MPIPTNESKDTSAHQSAAHLGSTTSTEQRAASQLVDNRQSISRQKAIHSLIDTSAQMRQALQFSAFVNAESSSAGLMDGYRGILQAKLEKLTYEKIMGYQLEKEYDTIDFQALSTALIDYEFADEDDIKALTLALDKVYIANKGVRSKVEDFVDGQYDSADGERRKELDNLLNPFYEYEAEIQKELEQLTHRLNVVQERETLEGDLEEGGYVRRYMSKLWSEEPGVETEVTAPLVGGGNKVFKTEYAPALGLPFVGEPKIEDVKQGFLGDCWILAPLISMLAHPDGVALIKGMIEPNDQAADVYTVSMYEPDERPDKPDYMVQKIQVLSRFPASDGKFVFALKGFQVPNAADGLTALWPAILEKAYAKRQKSFAALDTGKGASTTYSSLTGEKAGGKSIAGEKEKIEALWRQKKPITFAKETHYYALRDLNTKTVTLRNPHGNDEVYEWGALEKKGFVSYNTTDNIGNW